MDANATGPTFRANKRRKVFRKRAESDTNEDEPHSATSPHPQQTLIVDEGANKLADEDDVAPRLDAVRVRKPKKHGIAFSSSDRSSSRPHNDNEGMAMVVAEPQAAEQQNGRFTRQTGKTVVEDDKHMSAYIDSKLAEMRYASTKSNIVSGQPDVTTGSRTQAQAKAQLSPMSTDQVQGSTPLSPPANHATTAATTTTNLPKTPSTTSRRRNRPRRQPSPSTTARASLIDQIMRESNHHAPHYTPATPAYSPSNTENGTSKNLDPDAAAAEAFKADFLAQAEARNLSRRQPAINASAGSKAADAVPSGPKLGGSRAARERMRAVEEAKGKK